MPLHRPGRDSQKLNGPRQQQILRQAGMPLPGSGKQRIENPAPNPEIRILTDSRFFRDLIRSPEAYAGNVVRQPVRIFFYNMVDFLTVLLVDLHRQIHGNSIFLKKHHGLAQISLFLHLLRDLPGLPLADPLDLRKALRLPFHNVKGPGPEPADDAGCRAAPIPLMAPLPR